MNPQQVFLIVSLFFQLVCGRYLQRVEIEDNEKNGGSQDRNTELYNSLANLKRKLLRLDTYDFERANDVHNDYHESYQEQRDEYITDPEHGEYFFSGSEGSGEGDLVNFKNDLLNINRLIKLKLTTFKVDNNITKNDFSGELPSDEMSVLDNSFAGSGDVDYYDSSEFAARRHDSNGFITEEAISSRINEQSEHESVVKLNEFRPKYKPFWEFRKNNSELGSKYKDFDEKLTKADKSTVINSAPNEKDLQIQKQTVITPDLLEKHFTEITFKPEEFDVQLFGNFDDKEPEITTESGKVDKMSQPVTEGHFTTFGGSKISTKSKNFEKSTTETPMVTEAQTFYTTITENFAYTQILTPKITAITDNFTESKNLTPKTSEIATVTEGFTGNKQLKPKVSAEKLNNNAETEVEEVTISNEEFSTKSWVEETKTAATHSQKISYTKPGVDVELTTPASFSKLLLQVTKADYVEPKNPKIQFSIEKPEENLAAVNFSFEEKEKQTTISSVSQVFPKLQPKKSWTESPLFENPTTVEKPSTIENPTTIERPATAEELLIKKIIVGVNSEAKKKLEMHTTAKIQSSEPKEVTKEHLIATKNQEIKEIATEINELEAKEENPIAIPVTEGIAIQKIVEPKNFVTGSSILDPKIITIEREPKTENLEAKTEHTTKISNTAEFETRIEVPEVSKFGVESETFKNLEPEEFGSESPETPEFQIDEFTTESSKANSRENSTNIPELNTVTIDGNSKSIESRIEFSVGVEPELESKTEMREKPTSKVFVPELFTVTERLELRIESSVAEKTHTPEIITNVSEISAEIPEISNIIEAKEKPTTNVPVPTIDSMADLETTKPRIEPEIFEESEDMVFSARTTKQDAYEEPEIVSFTTELSTEIEEFFPVGLGKESLMNFTAEVRDDLKRINDLEMREETTTIQTRDLESQKSGEESEILDKFNLQNITTESYNTETKEEKLSTVSITENFRVTENSILKESKTMDKEDKNLELAEAETKEETRTLRNSLTITDFDPEEFRTELAITEEETALENPGRTVEFSGSDAPTITESANIKDNIASETTTREDKTETSSIAEKNLEIQTPTLQESRTESANVEESQNREIGIREEQVTEISRTEKATTIETLKPNTESSSIEEPEPKKIATIAENQTTFAPEKESNQDFQLTESTMETFYEPEVKEFPLITEKLEPEFESLISGAESKSLKNDLSIVEAPEAREVLIIDKSNKNISENVANPKEFGIPNISEDWKMFEATENPKISSNLSTKIQQNLSNENVVTRMTGFEFPGTTEIPEDQDLILTSITNGAEVKNSTGEYQFNTSDIVVKKFEGTRLENFGKDSEEPIIEMGRSMGVSSPKTINADLNLEYKLKPNKVNEAAIRRSDVSIEEDEDLSLASRDYENFFNRHSEENPFQATIFNELEVLQLIPVIIEQYRAGHISVEEKITLSEIFGDLWAMIVEEANRQPNEEVNPLLKALLTTREIKKRDMKAHKEPSGPSTSLRFRKNEDDHPSQKLLNMAAILIHRSIAARKAANKANGIKSTPFGFDILQADRQKRSLRQDMDNEIDNAKVKKVLHVQNFEQGDGLVQDRFRNDYNYVGDSFQDLIFLAAKNYARKHIRSRSGASQ